MDINELFKNVNNIDDYIFITHEIINKYSNSAVQLNITTVLALKQIRALEVEYLNKLNENGAATIILARLLTLPPSRIWRVIAKELVGLLRYWLDSIRKYLMQHSAHWWSFLKLILMFTNDIRYKDVSIPDILVQLTADCLFDIATNDIPEPYQRHEILHCLNKFCTSSSKQLRFNLQKDFAHYFSKLGTILSRSGYLPSQHVALEALVRWLVARNSRKARLTAADAWFPPGVCPDAARNVFVDTEWMNFYKDAREFLNALNKESGLVTSVVCKRLTIGEVIVVSGTERHRTWVDINSSDKSLSILLEPSVLARCVPTVRFDASEALRITREDAEIAHLLSVSEELRISVHTFSPPHLAPSSSSVSDNCDVTIAVTSKVDLHELNTALRLVFDDKYQVIMDLHKTIPVSPSLSASSKNFNSTEEDTRFSLPVEVKRTHSGCITESKVVSGVVSPSTTSTTSLAQLHEKLAALPKYHYDKEHPRVYVQPQLSCLMEQSETEGRSFHSISTFKLRQSGVCQRPASTSYRPAPIRQTTASDGEGIQPQRRYLSPVTNDDSTSCLLIATIGSADDSVINDTVERLSKSKEFKNEEIVDLLVQEALLAKSTSDSLTGEHSKQVQAMESIHEIIENTPIERVGIKTFETRKLKAKRICTVISRSTTDDESNTEAIVYNTPAVETPIKSKLVRKRCAKANRPKLVDKKKKANNSNVIPDKAHSETNEQMNTNPLMNNDNLNANNEQITLVDNELVEFLNSLLDKVCANDAVSKNNTSFVDDVTIIGGVETKKTKPVIEPAEEKNIRLKYNVRAKKEKAVTKNSDNVKIATNNSSRTTKRNKITVKETDIKKGKKERITRNKIVNIEISSDKQSLKRKQNEYTAEENNVTETKQIKDSHNKFNDNEIAIVCVSPSPIRNKNEQTFGETDMKIENSITKRKRKLYSPKDDELKQKRVINTLSQAEEDEVPLSELKTTNITKKGKATDSLYSDWERDRQKYPRKPRIRKSCSRNKESPSSKSLEMNAAFDRIKNLESNEKIVLVNKKPTQSDIYNFTSDSEDQDFLKKKNIKAQKGTSTSTGSFEAAMATRYGRKKTRVNYSEKSSNDEIKKSKVVKRKKPAKKVNRNKINLQGDPVTDLVDERMRISSDVLNTSILIENPKPTKPVDPELKLREPPQMEPLEDENTNTSKKMKRNKNTKRTGVLSLRKGHLKADSEDNRTISPLPGLIVESIPTHKDDNDSITKAKFQKILNIYHGNPDAINESSNTQNMLLEMERSVNNITEENCYLEYNKENDETIFHDKKAKKLKLLRNDEAKLDDYNMKMKRVHTISNDDGIKILERCDINNINKSDRSITTDGITAHGDINEAPPSPEMIRKSMRPREIEDLNDSMKDYFVKLNQEVNASLSENRARKIVPEPRENSSSPKQPVISLERLSLDDISKWLPSRRTSETDSSSNIREPTKSRGHIESRISPEHIRKNSPKLESSKNLQTPPLDISKISYEEFKNIFPMPSSLKHTNEVSSIAKLDSQICLKHVYNTRLKSKIVNEIVSPDRKPGCEKFTRQMSKTLELARICKNISDQSMEQDSDNTVSSRKGAIEKKHAKETLKRKGSDEPMTSQASKDKRCAIDKICISPVKSFKYIAQNQESDDDDCVRKIRELFSEQSTKTKTERAVESIRKTQHSNTNSTKRREIGEDASNLNESSRCRDSSPVFTAKRRRNEANVETVTIESGPSLTSVRDWFRRMEDPSTSTANDTNLLYKDTVQNVLEKLDTTLMEINQNTSKKLVNLFVDAQMQLNTQKEERHRLCKTIATEIIAEMVKKLEDLDKRSQEMDAKFLVNLKKQAFDFIREDCEQKRAMVMILKQDVQAVADHIEKRDRESL